MVAVSVVTVKSRQSAEEAQEMQIHRNSKALQATSQDGTMQQCAISQKLAATAIATVEVEKP